MAHHVTWYKDEATWHAFKGVCEDKDQFGPTYSGWVAAVDEKISELGRQGIHLVKVDSGPAEPFARWCRENGHPLNGRSRGLYLAQSYSDGASKH